MRDLIEKASTDDDREQRLHPDGQVIDRIRRTAPDFADLVDVRNHVRVSAEKIDLDPVSTSPSTTTSVRSPAASRRSSSRSSSARHCATSSATPAQTGRATPRSSSTRR